MKREILLHKSEQQEQKPLIVLQLAQQLIQYKQWDVWKTHPLCFLAPEEVTLVELMISHGNAEKVARAVGFTCSRIQRTMPLISRKLALGTTDYMRSLAAIYQPGGSSLADFQQVIMQRPIALLSNSFLANGGCCGAAYQANNLHELKVTGGVEALLQRLNLGSPPVDFVKLLQRFELHSVLDRALGAGQLHCGAKRNFS